MGDVFGSAFVVTFNINGIAHCPVVGVNVYGVVPTVVVEIVAGFHVPVIPFDEMSGNVGAASF